MSEPLDPETQPAPPDDSSVLDAGTDRDERTQTMPDASSAVPFPTTPPPAHVIGDFEITGKLGHGGMGTVYRARQKSLDRLVALKVLPAQFQDDEDFVARFQREARVAASLQHANLVRVFASGSEEGCHFIAMELVEGEDLRRRLKRGALHPAEALRICGEVARGLQCGWQRAQLIHRDIKPSNIYLSAVGEVKLGDLGLAKSLAANTTSLTETGRFMGTPHYISPEQARGEKNLDFHADIYSLGCTLYEMLTGHVPYDGADGLTIIHQHLHAPLPAILKALPGCQMPIVRLVGRMLKKHRHERHASYEDLLADIEWAREQLGHGGAGQMSIRPSAQPDPPPAPTLAPPRTASAANSSLWIGLSAGVLIVGAFAYFIARPPKPGASAPQKIAAATPATPQPAAAVPPPPVAASNVTPATAAQDAPFVNTLGMKFAPVPITGGPTGGQRVLFSVWETRVQDYAMFVAATQRGWRKYAVSPSDNHPAVGISWEDGKAFCAWLSQKEAAEYRQPSDHEWSCAVGIGGLEDAAKSPHDKAGKIPNVFPWGSTWPPPPNAGNYSGEEAAEQKAWGEQTIIPDYRDGFVGMSPVGSFAANPFGLFDLGGNAAEWCEELNKVGEAFRVARGASALTSNRGSLYSSARHRIEAWNRHDTFGFRVVLAPAPR